MSTRTPPSRVTAHMAMSLDGFIARRDGAVDWMETNDQFDDGDEMDEGFVEAFLASIDCYVMGARTYETALAFDEQGAGWAYGDKPTVVLTSRGLPQIRDTVRFYDGDLAHLVNEQLRPRHTHIWLVGGPAVIGAALRAGLVDEVRVSVLPVLIGAGIPFFQGMTQDVRLHLTEVKAYQNGMVEMCHEVRR